MAHVLLRQQAIELRRAGKSYRQIRSEIPVSKASLSLWLKDIPLGDDYRKNLQDIVARRIETYMETRRKQREDKLNIYYQEAKETWLPLNKRELFLAGLFLYWGEGGKTSRGTISISNTDPSVVQFALVWMINALDIPKEKVSVLLHLYEDMDVSKQISYWSHMLEIPAEQFSKPYIKKSNRTDLDEKGYGQGTCMLRVHNAMLRDRIIMALTTMGDYAASYIKPASMV